MKSLPHFGIVALIAIALGACTSHLGSVGESEGIGADAGFEESDPQSEPESESESDPEPSPESNPDPDPQPDPQPEPDPNPTPPPISTNQACYPGVTGNNNTCLPIVDTTPYNYPSGTGNYSTPTGYLDIDVVNLDTPISANFVLGEISVRSKGKYQVVQPHAIAKLQQLRNTVGHALTITSGFRSPDYNASVGGATMSRHMYGDAFDIMPGATGRDALMQMCRDLGAGYVAKYANSGHVHCDWRNSTVDSGFFGFISNLLSDDDTWSIYDVEAEMLLDDGVYRVEASGYDETEGELARDWIALDEDGNVLAEEEAMSFTPPAGTHTVLVDVGGLIEVEARVEAHIGDDAVFAP